MACLDPVEAFDAEIHSVGSSGVIVVTDSGPRLLEPQDCDNRDELRVGQRVRVELFDNFGWRAKVIRDE